MSAERYLRRIREVNRSLGAFVEVASSVQDGNIALAVKDNIDVVGFHAAAGMQAYRDRLPLVFTNCFKVEALTNHVHAWSDAIAPHLTRAEARGLRREAVDLCERIRQRVLYVTRQLAASASKPTNEP